MIRNRRKAVVPFLFRAGALVVGMITGCYHRVIAGTCSGGPNTYFCSNGASPTGSDTPISLGSGVPLQVFTNSGFGIDSSTNAGDAMDLTGTGGLQFNDAYASTITGQADALNATNQGVGTLSISTSGSIWGKNGTGISAHNNSTGIDLNITSTGYVLGSQDYGIEANNQGSGTLSILTSGYVGGFKAGIYAKNNGTDLNITTAGYIIGGNTGIEAYNNGTGSLSITASGPVSGYGSGGSASGIYAKNYGTNLSITTKGAVTGYYVGIAAINSGTGSLSITSSGPVSAYGYGIYAMNYGTNLNITTTGKVTGYYYGIKAINYGSGSLSISTSGTVRGGSVGILAANFGSDLHISAANVSGGYVGIEAYNLSGGSLSITTSGTITGTGGAGIYAWNSGGPITITVGAGSLVQGGGAGIYAYVGHHPGSGQPITITVNGQVRNISGSPSDYAIIADGGPVTVNLNAGSVTTGIVSLGSFNDTVNLAGTLNGSVRMGAGDDTLVQSGGSVLTGTADGGAGTDTLDFIDMNSTLQGSHYINFENMEIHGGNLTLTGTWDLAGGTGTVYSGNLYVNGSLTISQLTINSGGLLGGYGSINGDVIAYGTISPGHSIGTLTINGSLGFKSGSTYIAQLAPDGRSDLIRVYGQTSISGGTIDASPERALYQNGSEWTVLTATGGIHGSFSSVQDNSYTLNFVQEVRGDSLDLILERTPYADFGGSANQKAVGGALEALLPVAHGAMADLLTTMDFAMDPSQLNATLNGLNPEIYTSFAPSGMEIAGVFDRMAILRQQEYGRAPGVATGSPGRLWSVWGRALGNWLDRDEQDGVSGYTLHTGGAVFGMDRGFGSSARAGLLLGYTSSNLSWDEWSSSGSITGKHIGLYGSAVYKGLSWNATLGYTSLDNSGGRFLDTPVFTGSTAADFTSNVVSANLSGSYDFSFGRLHLDPTVSIGYQYLDQNGFTESGSTDFRLQVRGQTADSLTGALGVNISDLFETSGWSFRPNAGLKYIHQFEDDAAALTSNFVGYPSAPFAVTGQNPAANQIEADLGFEADYNRSFSLYLSYTASLACDRTAQLLSGGLVWWF